MTALEQILSILLNSKTGEQLPVATNFDNLDSFIIFSNNNGRIEKAQKSTTTGLFLLAENNLSDVDDVSTSQNNLNVYDRSVTYTQAQVDAIIAALPDPLTPQGNWDANTNTPDITGTTETGYFWIVSVAGSTNLGGITDWEVNDWAVKTGSGWAKVDNTQQNPSWGTIIGTLSNQTDLQNELDGKADLSGGNTISDAQNFTGTVNIDGKLEVDDDIEITQTNKGFYLNGTNNRIFFFNRRAIEGNSSGTTLTIGEQFDLTRVIGNFSAFGVVTFGTSGQSNELVILGDTGEDLTITKNLNGSVRFQNTNDEEYVFAGNIESSATIRTGGYTFATLPSSPTIGDRAYITDGSGVAYGATASGGSNEIAPVFYDGTQWIYS